MIIFIYFLLLLFCSQFHGFFLFNIPHKTVTYFPLHKCTISTNKHDPTTIIWVRKLYKNKSEMRTIASNGLVNETQNEKKRKICKEKKSKYCTHLFNRCLFGFFVCFCVTFDFLVYHHMIWSGGRKWKNLVSIRLRTLSVSMCEWKKKNCSLCISCNWNWNFLVFFL